MSTSIRPAGESFSLFDLFLSDLRSNSAVLRSGLSRRWGEPAQQQSGLAEAALAAHSVKSAARIVEFEPAARIAEALERRLQEAADGASPVSSELTVAVSKAVDALEQIALLSAAELPAWASAQAEYVEAVLAFMSTAPAPKAALSQRPRPASVPARRPAELAPAAQTFDPHIAELFRVEATACAETLSRGLVRLESGDTSAAESLMRAAHSIKGAARIVGIAVVARLAHALEECLVNIQTGRLALSHDGVDLMLAAVDVLSEVARCKPASLASWQAANASSADELAARLKALASGQPVTRPSSAAPLAGRSTSRPSIRAVSSVAPLAPARATALGRATQEEAQQDRVVRVAAQSINRLMGLAGESLVESRRVQSFSNSMQRLKRRQAELATELEALERRASAIDDAVLSAAVGEARARALDCRTLLGEHLAELDSYARRVDDLSDRLYREALKSRMRPFSDCAHGFPRMVRDVARQLGKEASLLVSGDSTDVDRDVLECLEAPLTHLLRNAVDHGLEAPAERMLAGKAAQGTIRLEARHHAGMLAITVSDDGRGIHLESIRQKILERGLLAPGVATKLGSAELLEFIFLPGFSTARNVTEISGRGVGLDAARNAVEAASGVIRVTSELGQGTTFHLQLPVTRSVLRAVLANVAGEAYAFPLLGIERVIRVPASEVRTLGKAQYFVLDDANIALVSTQQVLGLGGDALADGELSVVVVGDRTHRYGMVVDEFLGEHDLVVRPLSPRLGKVQDVAAAAILMDGSPALILDVDDLVRSVEKLAHAGRIDKLTAATDTAKSRVRKRILVVDDSITVREAERQLLVNRGYEVDVAVDGIDGLNSVRSSRYDLVISDIDMPRMNGIELVRTIKQDPKLGHTPIVIVSYKDREEDRMRGLDAGANYYLTKSSFHDETLLEAVEELIGGVDA